MAVSLRMNTQNSQINLKTKPAKMKISGQDADFKLKKTEGKFQIKQKSDTLDIDSYKAFKQLGLERTQDLMRSQGAKSRRKVKENISNYVRDGEAMMKIENKGNPVLKIAEKNAFKEDRVELNVTHFPQNPVEIRVKKGYLKVEAEPDKIEVDSKQKLNIDVTPGGVYTTVDRYPKVNIETVGEIYDSKA